VASEVRNLVGRSGLSKQDFAERIGTSRSRLSTYMSGKVVPSAALMVRMRRVASSLGRSCGGGPAHEPEAGSQACLKTLFFHATSATRN